MQSTRHCNTDLLSAPIAKDYDEGEATQSTPKDLGIGRGSV